MQCSMTRLTFLVRYEYKAYEFKHKTILGKCNIEGLSKREGKSTMTTKGVV
jgi:hypothetical protein